MMVSNYHFLIISISIHIQISNLYISMLIKKGKLNFFFFSPPVTLLPGN